MKLQKAINYILPAAILFLSGCGASSVGETASSQEYETYEAVESSGEASTETVIIELEEETEELTGYEDEASSELSGENPDAFSEKEETSEIETQGTEASESETESTPEPVWETGIAASVTGAFFIGDTLTASDFTVNVTMSDGSMLINPAGWGAAPLTLTAAENSITVVYGNVSTMISVSASERPVETSAALQQISGSSGTYTDPVTLTGSAVNGLAVVGTAMNWLGTVYSQDPNAGIDCSRLVKATLAAIGVSGAYSYGDANYNYLPGYTGQWRDVTNSTCFYYNGMELHFPVTYYSNINDLNPQIISAPGNIIMYQPTSGSSTEWHMAFTIGQFASRDEVIDWLVSVFGGQGYDEAYFAAHPELVFDYGNGYTYWRIHSGQDANYVRIDNGTSGHHPSCGWYLFQVNQ